MSTPASDDLDVPDRYIRQARFAPLGALGQRRLLGSRALICGCGALGTVLANTLARAGVGSLRIVDRDFIETSNLQRQVLFDEEDVAAGLPKAIAAANKLRRINSQIEIEPIVADVDHTNVLGLCRSADVLLDGTDNFETRYLLNDAAVKLGLPWVYGGCIGAGGQTLTILPGETACLRCIVEEPPPAGTAETCDTAGIVAPIVNVIASIQAMEAIKILSGHRQDVQRALLIFDLWENRLLRMQAAAAPDCPVCVRGQFDWLSGQRASRTAVLCGRNAVQLSHSGPAAVPLEVLAEKLTGVGRVTRNAYLLRLVVDGYQFTVFPDGRTIVSGTDDVSAARALYARYIGS